MGCRDRFLGWSAEARRRNLHLLACNVRFLILPWVEVRHLASHLLGQMTRRLSADWQQVASVGDPSIVSAAQQDPLIQEFVVRRRQGGRPRNEQLPDHLERRTERIEPALPEGIQLADCVLIGVDEVEILELEHAEVWVRRIEYPKYKLPAPVASASMAAGALADAEAEVEAGPVVDAQAVLEADLAQAVEVGVEPEAVANAEPLLQSAHDGRPSYESPTAPSDMARSEVPPAVSTEPVVLTIPADGILQAPREITLVPGGHFGFSVAAEVLFQKFGLHVPLYRQQDSWAQSGWSPNRSTLGLIVTHSAELFAPLAGLFRERVLACDFLRKKAGKNGDATSSLPGNWPPASDSRPPRRAIVDCRRARTPSPGRRTAGGVRSVADVPAW